MVCQIVFFHPVLWLAYRRLSWERELRVCGLSRDPGAVVVPGK